MHLKFYFIKKSQVEKKNTEIRFVDLKQKHIRNIYFKLEDKMYSMP